MTSAGPIGQSTAQASRRRARQSPEYRAELARLETYEEIAREVLRLRMDGNLSQQDLADLVGTTKSAISRLESGHHAPTVSTLRKIATAFELNLVISFEAPAASSPQGREGTELPGLNLAQLAIG